MKEVIVKKTGERFQIAAFTEEAYMRALRTMGIKRGPDQKTADDAESMIELVRILILSWELADGTKPLDGLTAQKARQLIASKVGLTDFVMKCAREAKNEEDVYSAEDQSSGN